MRRLGACTSLLALLLCSPATAVGESNGPLQPGLVVGASAGLETDAWYEAAPESISRYRHDSANGTLQLGVRRDSLELLGVLHASELHYGVGLEALYRLPFLPWVLVGGGAAWLPEVNGAALVLPRVDLRLPFSPSWELAINLLRVTAFDETLGGEPAAQTVEHDGYQTTSQRRIGWGVQIGASLGLVARLDPLWERPAPPPPGGGLLWRGSVGLSPLAAMADERADPRVAGGVNGDDVIGTTLGARSLFQLRVEPGWRLGQLELGLPLTHSLLQGSFGVGLSARWRPPWLDLLALGGTVEYFPSRWLILRVPEIELHYRWSPHFGSYLTPLSLLLVLEPTRDVWVEEGLESKAPYWGLGFAWGITWGAV